jgi:hypothetical protein
MAEEEPELLDLSSFHALSFPEFFEPETQLPRTPLLGNRVNKG